VATKPRPVDEAARRPAFGWAAPREAGLFTDLYELTMLEAYWRRGMAGIATFELYVRHLPPNRRFLVVAGLEQALSHLEGLRIHAASREYLSSLEVFDPEFVSWLGDLRFTGEVWAIAEGEIAYANEPLLRVTASLPEAQLVETSMLNAVLFQTMVASKAARCVIAAAPRTVVDFGARRAHGIDAAIKASRAAYLAGCAATSNVLAGRLYGIPVSGTMAHSFVMSFGEEIEAFRAYAAEFGPRTILLVDTYDTLEGVRRAAVVGREMAARGDRLRAVRLDSGDIAALAAGARRILDDAGLTDTQIFASGDLNEWRIAQILSSGAPVDAFGVGTEMATSADAPSLSGVYKLVSYAGRPTAKRSTEKETLGGRKQVWRTASGDVLAREDERLEGRPLLERVMTRGRTRVEVPSLASVRERCREAIGGLDAEGRSLDGSGPEPALSPGLGLTGA
jgi:nicotinate phosphoribosyltransferase